MKDEIKIIARNKKASHLYHILEKYEAGIELKGTEVKSLRDGKASLQESYAIIRKNEVFAEGLHINPYEAGSRNNHEPLRRRKLLLHKKEIAKLAAAVQEKGCTLVPISLYFKKRMAKMEIGLCKGKNLFDKRQSLKEKEAKQKMDRMKKGLTE